MRSLSDEKFTEWSHGIRRSDRSAFAQLFEATYDGLFGFARSIVRDPQAAHDVLQDAYAKLWQIRESVDPARSLKALLYQMVRNYSLNHQRQRKTRSSESIDDSLTEPTAETDIEGEVDTIALTQRIHRWIASMPERRREAFVLSRFEGLSHEEIARVMNLTPRTVNNHIVLALQDLRSRQQAFEAESVRS